jgi:hypothetical protein
MAVKTVYRKTLYAGQLMEVVLSVGRYVSYGKYEQQAS